MTLRSNPEDAAAFFSEDSSHFFYALLAAVVIEFLIVLAGVYISHRPQPVLQQPRVTLIHVVVTPKPAPPPPKPAPPPPKPMPPPPKPAPLPKPVPPPPKPMPRPLPKVQPRPVVHHFIAKPKPVPKKVQAPPTLPRPAPIPKAVQESALEAYASVVHDAVQADLQVPETVAMMHLSGNTKIALNIAPNGSLLRATILESSGIAMIDNAALATVRSAHFPSFSGKMPDHAITIEISVSMKSQ